MSGDVKSTAREGCSDHVVDEETGIGKPARDRNAMAMVLAATGRVLEEPLYANTLFFKGHVAIVEEPAQAGRSTKHVGLGAAAGPTTRALNA